MITNSKITGQPGERPLRMLMAGINWPPETFLWRLIDGLSDRGVEITVGCANRPDRKVGQVKWLPMPTWETNVLVRLARLAKMAARAAVAGSADIKLFSRAVRSRRKLAHQLEVWNQLLPYAGRRWDIIYFSWNSAAITALPVFDLGCPVIVSCRGTQVSVAPHNPERAEIVAGLNEIFRRAAAVHCVSEATLKDAASVGLNPAKVRLIRPAVDVQRFQPATSRTDNGGVLSVITVGTLIWVKGHEWALQAIRKLVDAGVNVRLNIIGGGRDRQRVQYTITDLGLDKHVHLAGKMSSEEVLSRVQQADVFLLSSLSEGISNAVLEAMACGVPVVTTECGGMREAVTDGVEGFVTPVRDAAAMAEAILKLAKDPVLRERMGKAARKRVEQDFNSKQQIAQWLELLNFARDGRAAEQHLNVAPVVTRTETVKPAVLQN